MADQYDPEMVLVYEVKSMPSLLVLVKCIGGIVDMHIH